MKVQFCYVYNIALSPGNHRLNKIFFHPQLFNESTDIALSYYLKKYFLKMKCNQQTGERQGEQYVKHQSQVRSDPSLESLKNQERKYRLLGSHYMFLCTEPRSGEDTLLVSFWHVTTSKNSVQQPRQIQYSNHLKSQ